MELIMLRKFLLVMAKMTTVQHLASEKMIHYLCEKVTLLKQSCLVIQRYNSAFVLKKYAFTVMPLK